MPKNIECPFCKELEDNIDMKEYFSAKRKTDDRTLYKTALCVETYAYPNEPDLQTGNLIGIHHELNFCPVCGKELKLKNLINTIREKYENDNK